MNKLRSLIATDSHLGARVALSFGLLIALLIAVGWVGSRQLLKGSSATLGLAQIAQICESLERLTHAEHPHRADVLIQLLQYKLAERAPNWIEVCRLKLTKYSCEQPCNKSYELFRKWDLRIPQPKSKLD
jgi:hypothetical protein